MIFASALVGLLLAIIYFGLIRSARNPNQPSLPQDQVATNHQTGAATGNENRSTATRASDNNSSASQASSERQSFPPSSQIGSKPRSLAERTADAKTSPDAASETGAETRSLNPQRAALPLSGIRKVHIEVTGGETLLLSEQLSDRLRASGQITVVTNRSGADAVLQVSLTATETGPKQNATVELINGRGQVIWRNANSSGRYEGSITDLTARIANDLLAAIKEAKRQQ